MQPRQGWQRQLLHASYVTNLKPTTTDRQPHCNYFFDNPTLPIRPPLSTDRQKMKDNVDQQTPVA
jgi:hypothetical protein